MERTMDGQEDRGREKRRSAVHRWIVAELRAVMVLPFFLLYITFVSRRLKYAVSGIQLALVKGF